MREDVPLLKDMNQRRRDLGISYELLSKRCGVSRPTVQRILSGRHTAASFANIVAIAESLGLGLRFDTKVDVRKLAQEQAERKATKLVALVQGTSGLEGQAVDEKAVESMVERTTHELLTGLEAKALERRVSRWELVPGETPIDVSGLKRKGINTRAELNRAEAENIRKVVVKYLVVKPSRRSAPFTLSWVKRLHKQMFGDVWKWAGEFRRENLNLGCDWHQVQMQLQVLLDDLVFLGRAKRFSRGPSHEASSPCGADSPVPQRERPLGSDAREHLAQASRPRDHRVARGNDRLKERDPG